jgi:hypothetical protein
VGLAAPTSAASSDPPTITAPAPGRPTRSVQPGQGTRPEVHVRAVAQLPQRRTAAHRGLTQHEVERGPCASADDETRELRREDDPDATRRDVLERGIAEVNRLRDDGDAFARVLRQRAERPG